MSLTVTGLPELIAALQGMGARVEAATPLAIVTVQAVIEGEARAQLSRYSHQRGTPTPSSPGEPPALITGRLRSSFELAGPTLVGAGIWESKMGPTAPYARIQELGGSTRHATLPARPYLRPAFDAVLHSGRLEGTFVRLWSNALTA